MNRAAFLLVLLMILIFLSCPASASQRGELVFRIVVEEADLQSGATEVNVNIALQNVGKQPIKFSPVGIGAQVTITNLPCTLDEDRTTESSLGDPGAIRKGAKLITIRPGETIWRKVRVGLSKSLRKSGLYSLSMTFSGAAGAAVSPGVFTGDLTSNEVLFHVEEAAD